MHRYDQKSGLWLAPDGWSVQGYSGAAEGRNNQALEAAKAVGPIPRGLYSIGDPEHSDKTGPYIMRLTPTPNTNTYGRADFEVHGDNIGHDASHGCIVIPGQPNRAKISGYSPRFVEVV